MKQATLHVNLDAILYNYRHLKCYYNKNVIAVLKDNAYGVGLLSVANTLKNEDGLIIAVSSIKEIETLRKNNIKNDILYLNVFDESDIQFLKENDVIVVVENLIQLSLIKKYKIRFHLKINSKMNRIGLKNKEIDKAIKLINDNVFDYKFEGIMTHFANEDKDHEQYNFFIKQVNKIKKKDIIIHCFASSSLNEYFDNKTTHIRVGLKLYGIANRSMFLQNALTLTSPILTVKEIKKDECVGYDLTYKCEENGYLYVLPIGYGNGLYRYNSSLIYVDNLFLKQAGKISMDYSTYFSTKKININKEVELFGNKIPIEVISKINNITPHQMIVLLSVNKKYYKLSIK